LESYYSFIKEESDENTVIYTFFTQYQVLYSVYFDAYHYQDKVYEYPYLLHKGYAFGFIKKSLSKDTKKTQDHLVFPTIYYIILDFLGDKDKDSILLYHCDSKDNKHPYRVRLFQQWESFIKDSDKLFRKCLNAQIGDDENNKHHFVYMGFITQKDNPFLQEVLEEFENFTIALALDKP